MRAAPGFLCLDHDPEKGKPALDAATLYEFLCELVPAAAHAGVVAYPSGSSLIYEGSKQHRGLAGMHLYVPIRDASDTERVGLTLSKRSWLAGRGRYDVSASGALLARTTWDEAVHQKARLLFAGGAVGIASIEQRRGEPVILSDGDFLDTRTACPDLTADEEARYIALVESAKSKARPAADTARQSWIEAKTKAELGKALEAGEDLTEARARIGRTLDAALGGSLLGSFALVVVDDQGKESTVTVDQVLADRDRYHLARALDPLNNAHRDRSPDAILYLRQAQPVAYSLDGGGTLWRLLRQPARLAVVQGEKARLAEQIADELATETDLFVVAGQVVQMQGGNVGPLSRPLLHYRVGCRVALYRQGKDKQSPVEPDAPLLDIVLALLPTRLRNVIGRATTPLICIDGRVISAAGFDAPTGLYLDLKPDECDPVLAAPTKADVVAALQRAWAPWSSYKWATPHDRAAMLATVLTIPIRPTIDAAPGLFADAAAQSSGKSKAIGAVAAMVRGRKGGMKTWIADQEQELEKYCLSSVRAGDPAIAFDNITGIFRSSCLATSIAEGKLNIRQLGANDLKTPDARVMWLASGNNCSLDRDAATRWLIARVDPGVEHPGLTAFRFDPVEAALNDRIGIVRSAIILHRAYHDTGRPQADKVPTRFAEWGRSVRQLVLWLRDSGIGDEAGIGALGDPAFSILEGSAVNDPESEHLSMSLQGLSECFGAGSFSAAAVRIAFDRGATGGDEGEQLIFEGFSGLLPHSKPGSTSAQTLNAAIKNRKGRIVGGLKIEPVQQYGAAAKRGALWRVQSISA